MEEPDDFGQSRCTEEVLSAEIERLLAKPEGARTGEDWARLVDELSASLSRQTALLNKSLDREVEIRRKLHAYGKALSVFEQAADEGRLVFTGGRGPSAGRRPGPKHARVTPRKLKRGRPTKPYGAAEELLRRLELADPEVHTKRRLHSAVMQFVNDVNVRKNSGDNIYTIEDRVKLIYQRVKDAKKKRRRTVGE